MKKIIKIFFTIVICLGITSTCAFAASTSMSGGSCKVGETVSVTLKYSGDKFGSAMPTFSYDTSILKFESYSAGSGTSVTPKGDNKRFLIEANDSSSMSITLKFKALKSGTASVAVGSAEGANWDEKSITLPASNCSVTVKQETTVKPSSKSGSEKVYETNKKENKSQMSANSDKEDVDPSIKPNVIPVVINEKTYGVVENLSDVEIPKGFKIVDIEYGKYKWKIQGIEDVAFVEEKPEGVEPGRTMILLKDPDGNDLWVFYNKEKGTVSLETSMENEEYLRVHNELTTKAGSESAIPVIIAASFAILSLLLAIYILVTNKKHKK